MSPAGLLRLPLLGFLFCATSVTPTTGSSPAAPTDQSLLDAIDAATSEEEGRRLLQPHLSDLKKLDGKAVEKVVLRQWWELAHSIVAASHAQKVDMSFSFRKAVRTLKDEADELLRTLNPKYAVAQQVSPAFQWAQNDTCIFITVKFTVRWNAPGALEATDPSVVMTERSFNFTGNGKHSNNKYRYVLSLSFFDGIIAAASTWSAASVGKMTVTLRKKWARKWPRLLVDKATKIGNMHLGFEMQEKMDSTLSGMSTAANSPLSCGLGGKLYCLVTDTCKKPGKCSQCAGKHGEDEETHVCTGAPSEKASLSFKDTNMEANKLGGSIKITKAKNEFDIDVYGVYFGKSETERLDEASSALGEVAPTGGEAEILLKSAVTLPEGATHLLVVSKNAHGEHETPGSFKFKDAVLPKDKPASLDFEDEDGEKGEVSGMIRIGKAAEEGLIEKYALYWGRSATRRLMANSSIADVKAENKDSVSHYIPRNTKPPDGATHMLVFSKNDDGDMTSGLSLKFTDNTKPCLNAVDEDCPLPFVATEDSDPHTSRAQATITLTRAAKESSLTHYVLYWGRSDCSGGGQSGAKNGFIQDLAVDGSIEVALPANTQMPAETAHILVFSKNKYGESEFCQSISFEDNQSAGFVKPVAEPLADSGSTDPAKAEL